MVRAGGSVSRPSLPRPPRPKGPARVGMRVKPDPQPSPTIAARRHATAVAVVASRHRRRPPTPPGPVLPHAQTSPSPEGEGRLALPPPLVLARTCPVLMMRRRPERALATGEHGDRRWRWKSELRLGEAGRRRHDRAVGALPGAQVKGRGSTTRSDSYSEEELKRCHRRCRWRSSWRSCRCVPRRRLAAWRVELL
jgi:hypothetical protein